MQCFIERMWPVSCVAILIVRRKAIRVSRFERPKVPFRAIDHTPIRSRSEANPYTKFHPEPGHRSVAVKPMYASVSTGRLGVSTYLSRYPACHCVCFVCGFVRLASGGM